MVKELNIIREFVAKYIFRLIGGLAFNFFKI